MSIVGALPNNIQDGQIADAVPVMANFQWIVDQVNANAGPHGANTQIQFNNSGAFGASSLLFWDGNNLNVGNTGTPGSGNGILTAGAITATHNSTVSGVTGASLRYDTADDLGYVTSFDWGTTTYKDFTVAARQFAVQAATGGPYIVTVDTNGFLLVNYTSSNGSYPLQVNGQIFATNATIATSDGSVKDNVSDLGDTTAIIRKLRPVTFNFIDHPVHKFAKCTQVGLIADDVQIALQGTPYADCIIQRNGDVTEIVRDPLTKKKVPGATHKGLLGMAEAKLIPLLIKTIQEMDARISALEPKAAP